MLSNKAQTLLEHMIGKSMVGISIESQMESMSSKLLKEGTVAEVDILGEIKAHLGLNRELLAEHLAANPDGMLFEAETLEGAEELNAAIAALRQFVRILIREDAVPKDEEEVELAEIAREKGERGEIRYIANWNKAKNKPEVNEEIADLLMLPESTREMLAEYNIKPSSLISADFDVEKSSLEILLNYTKSAFTRLSGHGKDPSATYSGEIWGPILKHTRGTVFRVNENDIASEKEKAPIILVAKGYPKFFNYAEFKDTSKAELERLMGEKSFEYSVAPKMDGSLGIIYLGPGGEPKISTRGSFKSSSAKIGQDILNYLVKKLPNAKKNALMKWLENGAFLLVEIISPQTHVHTEYGEEKELVLTGGGIITRGAEGMQEFGDLQLNKLAKEIGFKRPYEYDKASQAKFSGMEEFEKMLARVADMSIANKEGFVVTIYDNNGKPYNRVKLKYKSYILLMKKGRVNVYKTARAIEEKNEQGYIDSLDFETLDAVSKMEGEKATRSEASKEALNNVYFEVANNFASILKTFYAKDGAPEYEHFVEAISTLIAEDRKRLYEESAFIVKTPELPAGWTPNKIFLRVTGYKLGDYKKGDVTDEQVAMAIEKYMTQLPPEIRRGVMSEVDKFVMNPKEEK